VGPNGVAVADMNADGRPDVVVFNSSCAGCSDLSTVAVFPGNGDGTFGSAQLNTSAPYGLGPLVLGDLNVDGKPDAVLNANQVEVLLGTLGAKAPSSTSISASNTRFVAGQSVILKADVSGSQSSAAPSGTVTFSLNNTALASTSVIGGTARFSTAPLLPGSYTITAAYGGDAAHQGSVSGPLTFTITAGSAVPIPYWASGCLTAALLGLGWRMRVGRGKPSDV